MKAHLLKRFAVVAGVWLSVATIESNPATAVDFSFTPIDYSKEAILSDKFRVINSVNYDKTRFEFIKSDVNFVGCSFTLRSFDFITSLSVINSSDTPTSESEREMPEEIMEATGDLIKTMSTSVQETTRGVIGEEIERTDVRVYLILVLVILWMRLR